MGVKKASTNDTTYLKKKRRIKEIPKSVTLIEYCVLVCVENYQTPLSSFHDHPNKTSIGFPPSVIGTGRFSVYSSLAGLIPKAA